MNPLLAPAVFGEKRGVEPGVGKSIVFGILRTAGKGLPGDHPGYLQEAATGRDSGQVALHSIIHSDDWRGYNGLVDMGYQKHPRVHHGKNEFARGNCHTNGIESLLPDKTSCCVTPYDGNRYKKTFSCLDQHLRMTFAQLTYRESLRDIEVCLRAPEGQVYHRGIRGNVSRSAVADANERRDWRI